MSDDEFMANFERGSLSNDAFRHQDHVRMAFLYMARYPALDAIGRFSTALARFAAANGRPQLYSETITWAFLLLIRDRMARMGGAGTWTDFIAANGDLLDRAPQVLRRYYRDETLHCDLARTTFLFPDRAVTANAGDSA